MTRAEYREALVATIVGGLCANAWYTEALQDRFDESTERRHEIMESAFGLAEAIIARLDAEEKQ